MYVYVTVSNLINATYRLGSSFKLKFNTLNIRNIIIDYILSFTSAPLLALETKEVVKLFLEFKDWTIVRENVVEEDVLQKNTIATRQRYFRELKQRIELYTDDELKYFEEASMEEIRQLSFVGCLKRYRFIKEFLFEVVREKYLSFDYQIENSDYVSFYESKMTLSPNLSKASEVTLKKLKQVMFKMFADIGLIDSTKNHYIIKPMLSERIIQLVYNDDPTLLQVLLLNNDEIMHYAGVKQ